MRFRIAIVLSVIWVLLVFASTLGHWDYFIVAGIIPLVLLWGIWWAVKAKKKQP